MNRNEIMAEVQFP